MNFKSRKGIAALITVLSLSGLIFTIGMGSVIISFRANQNTKSISDSNKSFYAAQSGLQDASLKLERNKDYSGDFNLSVNAINDVFVSVANIGTQVTITSTASIGQANKRIKTVADINTTTGLIMPTSTMELTM